MSGTLYLFDEEEFQPSNKKQKDAARLEIASLRAKEKDTPKKKSTEAIEEATEEIKNDAAVVADETNAQAGNIEPDSINEMAVEETPVEIIKTAAPITDEPATAEDISDKPKKISSTHKKSTEEVITKLPIEEAGHELEEEQIADPLPNFKSDKQYHTISEVAKLFSLNVSHIRHWTTEFKLRVRKNRKGDRLYTEANIQELKRIYMLMMKKGHTIKGVKIQLQQPKELKREEHLKDLLTDLQHQLQLLAKQLN